MSCRRRSRVFSRQRRSKSRTLTGVSGGSSRQSGSLFKIAASVSETDSPWKTSRPIRHSKSTQPKEKMSVRLSSGLPRACSGLM